jgi:AAA ATPase domain
LKSASFGQFIFGLLCESGGNMHLDTIRLNRFRSCTDTTVKLRQDLTVLVGENNGGKSNVIDALRILTLPLNGRRDRYPEDDDVRRDTTESDFQIEGRFAGLSDTLKGLLIGAVPDPTKDKAILGMRYQPKSVGYPVPRLGIVAVDGNLKTDLRPVVEIPAASTQGGVD